VTATANLIGNLITDHANCSSTWVDNNLKKVTGVKFDGTRELHDTLVDTMPSALEAAKIPHRGGVNGRPSFCADVVSGLVSSGANLLMIKTRKDFKASFLTSSSTARRFGRWERKERVACMARSRL